MGLFLATFFTLSANLCVVFRCFVASVDKEDIAPAGKEEATEKPLEEDYAIDHIIGHETRNGIEYYRVSPLPISLSRACALLLSSPSLLVSFFLFLSLFFLSLSIPLPPPPHPHHHHHNPPSFPAARA
jgi:hypothetical protein